MTRPERFHELLEGLRWLGAKRIVQFECKMPPRDLALGDLKAWMRRMRAV